MEIIYEQTVLAVFILLFLSCLVYLIAEKLKLSYTLLLVISGFLLYFLENNFIYFNFLDNVKLSPNLVFYIFLPILAFDSAYKTELSPLKKEIIPALFLSILGVIVSTFVLGIGLYWLIPNLPFLVALLFGAIVSSTDPMAVLAIFEKLGVPTKLTVLIDSESLLNDGTALVFFNIIKSLVLVGSVGTSLSNQVINGVGEFLYVFLGGLLLGGIFSLIFSQIILRVKHKTIIVQILTILVANSTFIVAEIIGVSGVIAVVCAGFLLGNFERQFIDKNIRQHISHFFELRAFICDSLVFLLLGISVAQTKLLNFTTSIIIAILISLIARIISVYTSINMSNLINQKNKISLTWEYVIFLGGLRGALTIIMINLLPSSFVYKEMFLAMATGIICFTLLVNVNILPWFLRKFKII